MSGKVKVIYEGIITPSLKKPKLIPLILTDYDQEKEEILQVKEIIDKTTYKIFSDYQKELISEPITHIIPAVWGKIKQGTLTDSQREIHKITDSMVKGIMECLEMDEFKDIQRFAIEYLIRGLVISKITYLIEAFRNHCGIDRQYKKC